MLNKQEETLLKELLNKYKQGYISGLIQGDNINLTPSGCRNKIISSTGGGGSSYIAPFLKTGGASWSGTGLVYDVTALEYYFNGDKVTSATQVTLDASDVTYNRFDVIVVDEAGVISVIKGTAEANPVIPEIPDTQLIVSLILVEAGTVQPNISQENIYLDDPTSDWTFSTYTTGAATGSINFAGTNSPKQGVNDIEASTDARLGARFVRATSFDAYQYTMFQVWVRFTGTAVATNKALNVRFENSAGTLVGNTVNLFSYGLSRSILNTWQLVVVPITAFGALPATVKGLKVIMAGGTVGVVRQWDIDYMILTNGSVPQANVPTIVFAKDGTNIASQPGINVIEGIGVTINAVNNPTNNRVDYTINASGGGGSPAGSDTQIQYNNAGAFGADSGFTRDVATGNTNISAIYGGTDTYSYKLDNNLFGDGTVGLLQQYESTDGSSGYAGIIKEGTDLGFLVNIDNGTGNSFEIFGYPGEAGFIVDGSGFTLRDEQYSLALSHTQQSAVTFTGSGLDDLTLGGKFSGTVPTTYTVTIDGVNQDFLAIKSSTITGGTFNVGDTITSSSGGSATVLSISNIVYPSFGIDTVYLRVTVTSPFTNDEAVDNGLGVSGTLSGNVATVDTVEWTDGVITETNYPITEPFLLLNNGIIAPMSNTGHTLSDSWTWTYSTANQNVLDFSNNDYKFQSTFGTDTFSYQISDNLLGYGIKGAVNTWVNGSDFLLSGAYLQGATLTSGTTIQIGSASAASLLEIDKSYTLISDGTDSGNYNLTTTQLALSNTIGGIDYGIEQLAGTVTIGNLVGGNNTKITIDDVNEHITISNLPAYDDDTAAGTGGLTAGMVYMTTGSGSAPLNAAGILMIKQ